MLCTKTLIGKEEKIPNHACIFKVNYYLKVYYPYFRLISPTELEIILVIDQILPLLDTNIQVQLPVQLICIGTVYTSLLQVFCGLVVSPFGWKI